MGIAYARQRAADEAAARSLIESRTQQAAARIDELVRGAVAEVDAIARDLSSGALLPRDLAARVGPILAAHPDVDGIGVGYRPYALDPGRRLQGTLLTRDGIGLRSVHIEDVYDYTLPEHEWYAAAVSRGPTWVGPLYGEASRRWVIVYSAPIRSPGDPGVQPLGAVALTLSLDGIRTLIESLDLGPGGFGALVSAEGTYLYHPNPEFVARPTRLRDLAREQGDPDRAALADAAGRREAGVLEHRSRTTGLESWVAFAPVRSTGWSLQDTISKDDVATCGGPRVQRQLLGALVLAMIAIAAGSALLLRVERGREKALWGLSIVSAVVLLLGIGCTWVLSLKLDTGRAEAGVKIAERATLERAMTDFARSCSAARADPPLFVPTGIFLESAQFTSATDLQVTGFLWQRYRIGAHDQLQRGFTIGNAVQVESSESFRERRGEEELVRWQFRATVRQQMDHRRYPLEVKDVAIRVGHRDLGRNVVLVPDLDSYRFLGPASLPGLAPGLRIPGWQLVSSFFQLKALRFDTSFGAARADMRNDLPALHFSMVVRRDVLDAILSNLTPILIVASTLFLLVSLASRDVPLITFLQAGSGRIISICTGMFFVLALSHIEVRRRIASDSIFYMEYFYFLTYASILWVSVNSVLFATRRRIPIIEYRDNLVVRLAFWPFLLGALFVITVATFFG